MASNGEGHSREGAGGAHAPRPAAGADALLSIATLGGVLLALAVFVIAAPMPRILAVVPDDAAYYFKIAENASAGRGLTFDGISRTNGFQPLWLGALVPVYAAHRGEPETMFRVFLLLQLALLAAAAALVRAALRRFYPPHVVSLCGLLLVFSVLVPAVNGMESAILVLSLALVLYAGVVWGIGARSGVARHVLFGALLGLAALARLDTVFLPLAIGAAWLARAAARREGGRLIRELLGLTLGAAAVVAPYLAWNVVSFGSLMPISGALKSSFPAISLSGATFSHLGKRGLAGLLLAVCYLILYSVRFGARGKARPARTTWTAGLAVASAAVVAHFLHTVLFMRWAVFSWHFVPYAFLGCLIVCEPLERLLPGLSARASRAIYLLAVAVVLALGLFGLVSAFHRPLDRTWSTAAYEAALWARAETPPDAVFAMKDAGNFGYFSERSTINLDGVVNNLAYQRALRDRELGRYLARRGAGYIVQHAFWNDPDVLSGAYDEYRMSYRSHLYGTESDTITVRRSDEAYRSRPYFDGPYETVFLIWRLRSAER